MCYYRHKCVCLALHGPRYSRSFTLQEANWQGLSIIVFNMQCSHALVWGAETPKAEMRYESADVAPV
jgi:hypothetical protein